jgi:hypothetical protein
MPIINRNKFFLENDTLLIITYSILMNFIQLDKNSIKSPILTSFDY